MADRLSDRELREHMEKLHRLMKENPEIRRRIMTDPWGYAIDIYMAEGMTLEEAEAAYDDFQRVIAWYKLEEKLGRAVSREEFLGSPEKPKPN
jgi:hypothetical protein